MNKFSLIVKVLGIIGLLNLNVFGGTPHKSFSVWGGTDLSNNKVNSSFYFETYFPLFQSTDLKLSVGIYNTYSSHFYTVNTYKNVHIDDYNKIHLVSYQVNGTNYTVIPFGLGVSHTLNFGVFNPYLSVDINYSLIDPETIKTSDEVKGVLELNENIPDEYKKMGVLPASSLGVNFAVGSKFEIYSNLILGVRYQFNIRKEIVNSHQLLVGIYF